MYYCWHFECRSLSLLMANFLPNIHIVIRVAKKKGGGREITFLHYLNQRRPSAISAFLFCFVLS